MSFPFIWRISFTIPCVGCLAINSVFSFTIIFEMYFSLGMELLIALSLQWFGYVRPWPLFFAKRSSSFFIFLFPICNMSPFSCFCKISLYIAFAFRNVSIIYLGISIYPTWGLLRSGLKGALYHHSAIFSTYNFLLYDVSYNKEHVYPNQNTYEHRDR